jgi:hypothetical protein
MKENNRELTDDHGLTYEELIKLVDKNKPLVKLINNLIDNNPCRGIHAFNDTPNWEWDMDDNIFGLMNNDMYRDMKEANRLEGWNGWDYSELEESYYEYTCGEITDEAKTNDNNFLIITDEVDYISIHIASMDALNPDKIDMDYFKLYG